MQIMREQLKTERQWEKSKESIDYKEVLVEGIKNYFNFASTMAQPK